MNELEKLLPTTLERMAERAPHDPGLALTIARRGRRRRGARVTAGVTGGIATLAAAGTVGVLVLQPAATDQAVADQPAPPPPCLSRVQTGPVPSWARDQGYSGPDKARHVLSADCDLVAILPAEPLAPAPDPASGSASGGSDAVWVGARDAGATGATGRKARVAVRANGTGPTRLVSTAAPLGRFPITTPKAGCYTYAWTVNGETRELDLEWTSMPELQFQQPPLSVQRSVRSSFLGLADERHLKSTATMDTEYAWVRTTRAEAERVLTEPVRSREVSPGVTAQFGGTPFFSLESAPDATVYVAQVRRLSKLTLADLGGRPRPNEFADDPRVGDGTRILMVKFDEPRRDEYTDTDGKTKVSVVTGWSAPDYNAPFVDLSQLGTPYRAWLPPIK